MDVIGERTRADIFALVLTAGPISRTSLAERLALSPSTVTRLLPPLMDAGYLSEEVAASSGPGRPQRLLEVNKGRHHVVGIKIAPTHVSGVLTDLGARVLSRKEVLIPDCAPEVALAAAVRLTRRLLADLPGGEDTVLGVGIGVSGHVDSVSGVCRYSAILGWQKVDVAGPVSEATGLSVVVNNDVNTLVVAERWFGAGRDVDSFAVVTVGPGVGCGLLLEGSLYAGSTGMAGELGHFPLDPAGPECSCGRRGCLEALASSGAIVARLRSQGVACPDITAAMAAARGGGAGHDAAATAFDEAGTALGRGLAALCNLLNLQMIILSGEGVAAHDLFGEAMDGAWREHSFSDAAVDCELRVAPAEDDLWARGAACLVISESVRAPLS